MFWLWLIFLALSGLGLLLSLVVASVYRRWKPNHFVTAAWTCAVIFLVSLIGFPLYAAFDSTQRYASEEALVNAAREGKMERLRAILADGTNVNAELDEGGGTALIAASGEGHLEVVKFLLRHGADVNQSASSFSGEQTPLQAAAKHPEIVKLLKKAGAK